MASERQIEANRKNARRSTGPKTAAGKAKSSRNAFRHGLSRPAPANEAALEKIGETILLELGKALCVDLTELVSAKLELHRIRSTRAHMLAALLRDIDPKAVDGLRGLLRYERAAFARQKRLLKESRGRKT